MESAQWSGRSPIAVAVIALFIGLLGTLSLSRLPLQLFPDINRPEISIQCTWRTASPEEVESELLEPLENVLQGMPGVEEIEGNANAGAAQINLRFALGTDMKNALVEVIGRLNRLRPLPRDADRPIVTLGGGDGNANETLSWFFVQQLPGTSGTIESQRRFIEDTVRARLEAVPGVAAVNVNAGPPDDVRITVDLAHAACRGRGSPGTDVIRHAPRRIATTQRTPRPCTPLVSQSSAGWHTIGSIPGGLQPPEGLGVQIARRIEDSIGCAAQLR